MRVIERIGRFLFSARRPVAFVDRGYYHVSKHRAGGTEYMLAERY